MSDFKRNEEQLVDSMMKKVNLSKDNVNLTKHVVNLSKTIINLSKESMIDLGDKKARVVVVLDYSGSMRKMYNDGTVQNTLTRLVPLGMQFDDNGTIDTYVFRNDFTKMDDLNLDNYDNYVIDVIQRRMTKYGRTVYSPVLRDIYNHICKKSLWNKIANLFKKIFGKKEKDEPVFVLFITDGGNEQGDNVSCDNIIRQLSKSNCFVQFVGIGSDKFKYFSRLPKIKDRKSNNTGSTIINDLANIGDSELYNVILEQFAKWLKEMEE